MTETGFKYFLAFMQERSEQLAAKKLKKPRLSEIYAALSSPPPVSHTEDYTGSVCVLHNLTDLTPAYREVLIDADDLERVAARGCYIVYGGRSRLEPRVYVAGRSTYYLHRFVTDAPPDLVVDHRFHNPLDNRKGMLRLCTTAQNNLNRRPRRKATSQYKGVTLCKKTGKWIVQCGRNGSRVFLGKYQTEIDAARVYNAYASEHYGSMAYLNPIQEITR